VAVFLKKTAAVLEHLKAAKQMPNGKACNKRPEK
jgi:hypothetical protein